MKTRISQLAAAAIFTLVFLGGNVKAEGTELNASSHENITEPALEMENWMINSEYWETTGATINFYEATEENLELENWMTDENIWETAEVFEMETVNETESELNLEPWMINNKVWFR